MLSHTTQQRAGAHCHSSRAQRPARRPTFTASLQQQQPHKQQPQQQQPLHPLLGATVSGLAGALLLLGGSVGPAAADFKLPPIDSDPQRCDRGYVGNTIGQANAVSDKVLDLRKCVFAGKNLSGKTLAGALLVDTDMSNTTLNETVLTKSYAVQSNFAGADMTNAVVDRVDFSKANLKGAKFINAVVTGATFDGADLSETIWEDALIGNEDVKRLCSNPTLTGESRMQVGCRATK